MKYTIPIALLFTVFFTSHLVAEVTPIKEALVNSAQEPSFNDQEEQALKIAKEWRSNNYSTKPIRGADGSVSYYYGLFPALADMLTTGGLHYKTRTW